MPYELKRLESEPIIILTWHAPTNLKEEAPAQFAELDALIGLDDSVYCITDLRDAPVNFSELVQNMAVMRQKAPGAPSDPRVKTILVGTGTLWEIAAKGARQLQYGGIDMPLFSSMEDALAHARSKASRA